jgi:hypothetical protein
MPLRKTKKQMPANSLTVVRQLARQVGAKTTPINLYDRNVCVGEWVADRPCELVVLSGEVFCLQLHYTHKGRRARVFANRQFINASAIGSFNVGSILSINKRNAISPMGHAEDRMIRGRRYPLFTKNGNLAPEHEVLLAHPALAALIESSFLKTDESLHFFDDQIGIYLDKPTLERLRETINRMMTLAAAIQAPEEEMDLASLPVRFHPLIPLIAKWGVADDHERECFLRGQPQSARRRFVETVAPYLHSIDSYLSSFGERQPSEEAAALGHLAECAVEAQLLGANRGKFKR